MKSLKTIIDTALYPILWFCLGAQTIIASEQYRETGSVSLITATSIVLAITVIGVSRWVTSD